jgi:hypothetical protein
VIAKQSDTHVLIRRGRDWWVIGGQLEIAKCGKCGTVWHRQSPTTC